MLQPSWFFENLYGVTCLLGNWFTDISAEGNHSPSLEEGEAVSLHHKKEAADIFEGEEVEFPKENGARQSNNIKVENRSDKTVDRQPDVVDDHPGKSRFILHFALLLSYSLCLQILSESEFY